MLEVFRVTKNGMRKTNKPAAIKKEGIEKSIKATGATFTCGADKFEDLKAIAVGLKKVGQFLYGNLPLFLIK